MGDKEFESYLEGDQEDLGKEDMDREEGTYMENNEEDTNFFLMFTRREKFKSISEMYSKSLEFCVNQNMSEKLRVKIENHLEDLIKESMITLKQFDYLMIEADTEDDEEE